MVFTLSSIGHHPPCVYPLSIWRHRMWPDLLGLLPPYFHTVSDQILEVGTKLYSISSWCSQCSHIKSFTRHSGCVLAKTWFTHTLSYIPFVQHVQLKGSEVTLASSWEPMKPGTVHMRVKTNNIWSNKSYTAKWKVQALDLMHLSAPSAQWYSKDVYTSVAYFDSISIERKTH